MDYKPKNPITILESEVERLNFDIEEHKRSISKANNVIANSKEHIKILEREIEDIEIAIERLKQ